MAVGTKYNKWQLNQLNGTRPIDWDTDTIKVMLVTSLYTPSATTHANKSDITNEVTGTNYTAGGNTLSVASVTEAAGVTKVDFADTSWLQSGAGFTNARYAIFYKDTGVATTSPVAFYYDFTADKGNVAGDLTLQLAAGGLFTST